MKPIRALPSQGESKINRNHLKKPPLKKNNGIDMRDREGGFSLGGEVVNSKLTYDPINDEHLKQFFVNTRVKKHLHKLNKILNKSIHTSDDESTRLREDSSRGLSLNKQKESQTALLSAHYKSDSETKDSKNSKHSKSQGTSESSSQQGADNKDEPYKQKEGFREYEKESREKDSLPTIHSQQLELPKIVISNCNNSNMYQSCTINSTSINHLNSTKESSTINQNNTNSSIQNHSINNISTTTSGGLETSLNKNIISEGIKKNDSRSYYSKSNLYQQNGLRNKIILRPLSNHEKAEKESIDMMKVYGSVQQQENPSENYKLGMKRNSQYAVNSSSLMSDYENLSYSDFRINPLGKVDLKKRTRSITSGYKKQGIFDSNSQFPEIPTSISNMSMYEGSAHQQKKFGALNNSTNFKNLIKEQPTQPYMKNLSSEIENLEKINESKGIHSVSKHQFSSFMDKFKQKYNSNVNLNTINQNSTTINQNSTDQVDSIDKKKADILLLRKVKKDIIKRQEKELEELEIKIMEYESQEKQIQKDIYYLDKEQSMLFDKNQSSSYYLNKILIPSPKEKNDFIIHEQVQDEETYRSPPKKSKIQYTEEIQEDFDEMLYTRPAPDGRKKWFSNDKDQTNEDDVKINSSQIRKSQEKIRQSQEKIRQSQEKVRQSQDKTKEQNEEDAQKTVKKKPKSKKVEIIQRSGYETDELQNNQNMYEESTNQEMSSKKPKRSSQNNNNHTNQQENENEKENQNLRKSGVTEEFFQSKSEFRVTNSSSSNAHRTNSVTKNNNNRTSSTSKQRPNLIENEDQVIFKQPSAQKANLEDSYFKETNSSANNNNTTQQRKFFKKMNSSSSKNAEQIQSSPLQSQQQNNLQEESNGKVTTEKKTKENQILIMENERKDLQTDVHPQKPQQQQEEEEEEDGSYEYED